MRARPSLSVSSLAAPGVLLFVAALAARIGALGLVRFPLSEGSAYYVEVARNLADGRGLVVDSIWSYATPPLTLPRPAFELWQPLASFVAAIPMVLLGPTFSSAQLGFAILGALLAPLAWLIARDAAKRLGLPEDRGRNVALGTGLAVALGGPFVMTAAVPDSTLPFAVLATAACLVLPAATQGRSPAVVALGVLAGLTYLVRMEAVFLGVAFLFVGWRMQIGWGSLVRRGVAVALIAAAVAVPWWLRNVAVFGTPLPGQIADNLLLTSNAQIFAFSQRPTLDAFLAQGLPVILGNVGAGLWHNVVDVLLVPAAAFSVVGLLAVLAAVAGRRWTGPDSTSAFGALTALGLTTLVVTSVLFPVSTLWGTFEHAAGPLLVALAVAAMFALDAFIDHVRNWRAWPRSNAWLVPAVLVALAVPLTTLQITLAGVQSGARERQMSAVASVVSDIGLDPNMPLITDHPIWLSAELGQPALALPDEGPQDVLRLARQFGSRAVVVIDGRGSHRVALRGVACFVERTESPTPADAPLLAIFSITEGCS